MGKRVLKISHHTRYNIEKSPDNPEMVRLHLVVVDDKDRDVKIAQILHNTLKRSIVSYPFEPIRQDIEGKVGDSGLRYLFETYDTKYSPEFIKPEEVSKNVVQDPRLKERKRKGFTIENYVADLYDF